MHLIICFRGKPGVRGVKCREFFYDPAMGLFVWQNRKLTPEEFNAEAPKVFERNAVELPLFAMALFEKGDATETGKNLAHAAEIKELTDKLAASEQSVRTLQGEVSRLLSLIGTPPEGSHPDEAAPRSQTWHAERLAWQGEVETLRRHVTELNEKLSGIAAKGPAETPFVRPEKSKK